MFTEIPYASRFARGSWTPKRIEPLASLDVVGLQVSIKSLALLEAVALPRYLMPLASLEVVGLQVSI